MTTAQQAKKLAKASLLVLKAYRTLSGIGVGSIPSDLHKIAGDLDREAQLAEALAFEVLR
jgi:hypothetical protein